MFEGYKVVITGATSGMGLATAKKMIADGATVIAIGRNFAKVGDLGDRYIPFKCEVRDPEQIEAAVKFIDETFGGELDTFINAAGAGTGPYGVKNITVEAFEAGLNMLLRAPLLFGKALYPMLLKSPHKNGSIVNIASASGHAISGDNMIYNICKHAHIHLTKQQAQEYIGIRSNSVSPGFIDTPIFAAPGTDMPQEAIDQTFAFVRSILPIPRIGTPDEAAEVICFLASEDAMYLNGADIAVDGGLGTVVSG